MKIYLAENSFIGCFSIVYIMLTKLAISKHVTSKQYSSNHKFICCCISARTFSNFTKRHALKFPSMMVDISSEIVSIDST